MKIDALFDLCNAVKIDGDPSLKAVVTAILVRVPDNWPMYECSWISDGNAKTAWIEEWRLSLHTQ